MSISIEITNENGKFMLRINQLYWIGSFLQLLGMLEEDFMTICERNNAAIKNPLLPENEKYQQKYIMFDSELDAQNTIDELTPYLIIKKSIMKRNDK